MLVARRARRTGNVFWGCSRYPKCDFTTNDEPTGAVHDASDAAHADGRGSVARKGEGGICLTCGATVELPSGVLVGLRLAGGPANPAALERPARGGRRGATKAGDRRCEDRDRHPANDPVPGRHHTRRNRFAAQERVSGVGAGDAPSPDGRAVTGSDALLRFLRSLEARDLSPETIRSYESTVAAYLDWLAAHDADWRSPGRATLRAYLAELSVGHARTSVAQRLAALRAFHRYCARSGLAPGDPWGAVATPRLPRRLPKVLEVEQVEALLAVIDDDLVAAAEGTSRTARHDPELARAIALRDRALVETAYAAGLRISELAAADLASLDLRRGELRVMGKGRKERIGLLGRPAREALTAYLDEARPVLDARRDPLGARPRRDLPQPSRRPARRPGPADAP